MHQACLRRGLILALMAAYSLHAVGDELPKVFTKNSERVIKNSSSLPIAVQVALDGGLLTHTPTIPREGPFSGSLVAGKSLASLLFDNWIVEAGLGWSYSALYGVVKGENPTIPDLGKRIYTQSAFGELGLRFRFTPDFHFGLIAQDYFGTDLTLSQRENLVNNMLLAGGMVGFDILGESGIFRLGGQLLAEVIDNQRQVVYYGATLQFGIPITNNDVILRKTDIVVKRERVQKIEIPKVVTRTVVRDVTKYSLPLDAFRFIRSQTALNPDDQFFASALAQTLKEVATHFKTVTIETAIKPTGDARRDLYLSENRAQSIRNAIVSAGSLQENRILAKGLGGRASLDDRQSAPLPTYVDLSFTGVTNSDAISDALNQLMRRKSTPETCRGEKCK